MFNRPGQTGNRIVGGLSAANFALEYLSRNGSIVADPVDDFSRFNSCEHESNFQHRMLIPFGTYLFTTPDFATTLRRESLGVPRDGVIQPC